MSEDITISAPAYGAGDQVAYTAKRTEADGTITSVTFVGSRNGAPGPVVVVNEDGNQVFVVDAGRFGDTFDRKWVENFLARDI